MWIMIRRKIPVQEQYRPEFMGIYWALPWLDPKAIESAFEHFYSSRYSEGLRDFVHNLRLSQGIPFEVFQNIHDESRYPEEFAPALKLFVKSEMFTNILWCGFENNPVHDVRVIVNNEAVKIHGQEYAKIDNERLIELLKEGLYQIQAGPVAEQKILDFALDEITKPVYDAALVDGCDHAEALLMAMGTDVSDRYEIPPIGWYKYIGPDLGINPDTFGQGLNEINHQRRAEAHKRRQGAENAEVH